MPCRYLVVRSKSSGTAIKSGLLTRFKKRHVNYMLACLRNSITRRTNSGVRGVFAGFHSTSIRQDNGQDGLGALGRDVAANPGTATSWLRFALFCDIYLLHPIDYVPNPDSRYRSFSANEAKIIFLPMLVAQKH